MRVWITGLSLLSFGVAYAAPVITALQLQPVTAAPAPLPSLALPTIAFPSLEVPKVSPPLPRAAMP